MIKKLSIILGTTALVLFSLAINAQEKDQSLITQAADKAKLVQAQQEYYKGDYVKALNLYKEVLNNNPNDASLHFHVGEVYFAMKQYDDGFRICWRSKMPSC